jgi:hypothetical protein
MTTKGEGPSRTRKVFLGITGLVIIVMLIEVLWLTVVTLPSRPRPKDRLDKHHQSLVACAMIEDRSGGIDKSS